MFRSRQTKWLVAACASWIAAAGCTKDEGAPPPMMSADAGTNDNMNPQTGIMRSAKSRVQVKRAEQLAADLAQALELPGNEICQELGVADCFTVHRIPLGGVAPYVAGIFEPLENTTITTPLAIDRIALAGCAQRVDADGFGPNGVIFRDIPVNAGGRFSDFEAPGIAASVDRLYKRVLQRPPTDDEVRQHIEFYGEVASADEPRTARAWAILTCFTVVSHTEALFY